MSLSSSYSKDDEIYRLHKRENESDTEFSDSGKGWLPIWGEITLPKFNIDGDSTDDWQHKIVIFTAIFKIKTN